MVDGMKILEDFADLEILKVEQDSQLKRTKEKLENMQGELLDFFTDSPVEQIKVKGRTIYLKRSLYAKIHSKELAIKALKAEGLDALISEGFNTNTLSSYLRELEHEGEEIPDSFKDAIEAIEIFKVQSTKS